MRSPITEAQFAILVRQAREARQISQAKLAELLQAFHGIRLDPTAITRLERGDRGIRLNEAAALADVLDITLFDRIKPRPPTVSAVEGATPVNAGPVEPHQGSDREPVNSRPLTVVAPGQPVNGGTIRILDEQCGLCGRRPLTLGLTRKRNGVMEVKAFCPIAHAARSVPLAEVPGWEGLPLTRDSWREDDPCERCGEFGTEYHHWAPRAHFSDWDNWPGSRLCPPCHREWHRVIRGARWRPPTGRRYAWPQRGAVAELPALRRPGEPIIQNNDSQWWLEEL